MKQLILCVLMLIAPIAMAEPVNGTLKGTILNIAEEFGNINTSVSEEAFDELNVVKGSDFLFTVGETTVTVRLGSSYSDVERGEWIAFFHDLGQLRIARNFENAAETLSVKEGDEITLTAINAAPIE